MVPVLVVRVNPTPVLKPVMHVPTQRKITPLPAPDDVPAVFTVNAAFRIRMSQMKPNGARSAVRARCRDAQIDLLTSQVGRIIVIALLPFSFSFPTYAAEAHLTIRVWSACVCVIANPPR